MAWVEVDRRKENPKFWIYRKFAWITWPEIEWMYGSHAQIMIRDARCEIAGDATVYYYVQVAVW